MLNTLEFRFSFVKRILELQMCLPRCVYSVLNPFVFAKLAFL